MVSVFGSLFFREVVFGDAPGIVLGAVAHGDDVVVILRRCGYILHDILALPVDLCHKFAHFVTAERPDDQCDGFFGKADFIAYMKRAFAFGERNGQAAAGLGLAVFDGIDAQAERAVLPGPGEVGVVLRAAVLETLPVVCFIVVLIDNLSQDLFRSGVAEASKMRPFLAKSICPSVELQDNGCQ